MILVINVCFEPLHYNEFVRPVVDIVESSGYDVKVCFYKDIDDSFLRKAERIIICGTSLLDNAFASDISFFHSLKDVDCPVLGICAGMQIIGLLFGAKRKKCLEIGYFSENFSRDFLGVFGDVDVYHLHDYYVDFNDLADFEIFSTGAVNQAVKHRNKEIYGVLFHPEVRNEDIILNFLKV